MLIFRSPICVLIPRSENNQNHTIPTSVSVIDAVLIIKNASRTKTAKPIENNIPILLAPSIQNPKSPRKNDIPAKILTIKTVITPSRAKNHMSNISPIIPIGNIANDA